MKKILSILLQLCIIPFLCSIPFLIANVIFGNYTFIFALEIIALPAWIVLVYFLFRKKLDLKLGYLANGLAFFTLLIVFTIMMIIAKGNIEGTFMQTYYYLLIPFGPVLLIPLMMNQGIIVVITALLSYLFVSLYCAYKIRIKKKNILIIVLCACISMLPGTFLYLNRPAIRYGGHGFDYMNGYSSTDFTDYTVYAKHSKLVQLDHPASLRIEKEEDMPVLDGAEACYPLYAALAKAVYKDIDQIELDYLKSESVYHNGKIVTFTNTIYGFNRLINNDPNWKEFGSRVDMFFGARPSEEQMEMAREVGVEIEITPIGKEAFVFFVEKDNPIENLSSQDIRKIYSGEITNWKELGGKNKDIIPFQRPENSGSQTMMTYFMQDVPLKPADTFEMVNAMGGVIHKVAEYTNEKGAMGYTFRYFLEELQQEKGVKMLAVDGIYPSLENIENGTYPLLVDLCLITRAENENPYVEIMKEYILSQEGQEIIKKTGYGALY
ncbi:MAG: substrate-binding domain-containing protein [Bacillota bacterium]|nr:substrate-binding domain-containing protein [Bacillota bacterium]